MMIVRHAHRWLLLVLGLLLVAGHAVVLRYAWSHLSLSAAAVVGVIALVTIKYLALRRGLRASRRWGDPMTRLRLFLATLLLSLPAAACDGRADSVVGRWERTRERTRGQGTWVQFESDGTFMARVGSDTSLIRGTYTQRGATLTVTGNYTRTMTLRDSILVVEDGTEYRRASSPP